jgi:hypothetical protein
MAARSELWTFLKRIIHARREVASFTIKREKQTTSLHNGRLNTTELG